MHDAQQQVLELQQRLLQLLVPLLPQQVRVQVRLPLLVPTKLERIDIFF